MQPVYVKMKALVLMVSGDIPVCVQQVLRETTVKLVSDIHCNQVKDYNNWPTIVIII